MWNDCCAVCMLGCASSILCVSEDDEKSNESVQQAVVTSRLKCVRCPTQMRHNVVISHDPQHSH